MVLGKNIRMKVKVKVVILKTLPPSLEQAGSVLLPMVDYSLGGDGGMTVIGVMLLQLVPSFLLKCKKYCC